MAEVSVDRIPPHLVVGVLGGMGPEATVDFMSEVIGLTDAERDAWNRSARAIEKWALNAPQRATASGPPAFAFSSTSRM